MTPLYHIAYYFLLPGILLPFIWIVYQKKKTLKTYEERRSKRNKFRDTDADSRESTAKSIKKYQTIMIVLFLILLPLWHVTTTMYCDHGMHRELWGKSGYLGPAYSISDPVQESIGPSYDIERVKSQMKEAPKMWGYEQVNEAIDFDELTKLPGSLAVYRIRLQRLVVTYTYLSPYPIIKTFGFMIKLVESEPVFMLMSKDTLIFPQNPNSAGRVIL